MVRLLSRTKQPTALSYASLLSVWINELCYDGAEQGILAPFAGAELKEHCRESRDTWRMRLWCEMLVRRVRVTERRAEGRDVKAPTRQEENGETFVPFYARFSCG